MKAATEAAVQTSISVIRYGRIGFILASAFFIQDLRAEDPPVNLIKRIVERETETQRVQANYTYRQTMTVEEFDPRGARSGEYKEVRDVVFSPAHERTEQLLSTPRNSLTRLKMTEEDFRDLREVQPFLLTKDQAFIYETRFRGEETIDGRECWIIQVKPKQILQGQRLFAGMFWVDKTDFSIVRNDGEAVPQIRTTHTENLFPRFKTTREKVDGGFWFPAVTSGDDTLQFKTGPQRMKLTIRYSDYRKFGADSKITFGK